MKYMFCEQRLISFTAYVVCLINTYAVYVERLTWFSVFNVVARHEEIQSYVQRGLFSVDEIQMYMKWGLFPVDGIQIDIKWGLFSVE